MKPETWRSPHGTPLPMIGERTLIMGILNVTPDSFSDGGAWDEPAAAVEQVGRMVAEGADIIDIGGESTRPGSRPVPAEEEAARTIPVIQRLRREFPDLPLSIDTYKAQVAAAAIDAGADMINDVWGFKYGLSDQVLASWSEAISSQRSLDTLPPSPMAQAAAEKRCPVFLMHNRAKKTYSDFWTEIIHDLNVSIQLARTAGVADGQIWLDPGFGFGKEPKHNLEVLKHVDRLAALGYPLLLGTSRKSTIGLVLDRPVDERLAGTAATVVWGIAKGCQMVRVHDVAPILEFIKMADAIEKGIHHPFS